MKTTTLAALTVGVLAPSLALAIRDLCGKTETWHNEFYTVNNNLWGVEDPSNPPGGGSQCSWVDSQGAVGSELLTWHTSWTWPGGTVKSYAYAGVNFKPLKVGDIKALSNNAEWSYRNWPSAGNVAYDLFTSHNETHVTSSGDYEIMVW
jgi:hypothetical protein